MSRLHTALGSWPIGSIVTRAMQADRREFLRLIDAERTAEVARAKALQRETGCTWAEALRGAA